MAQDAEGRPALIFTAAAHAQRAVDYLHDLQPDDTDDDAETMFENHYRCPRCGHEWTDTWPHQCDDDCPSCGMRHISPYRSDDAEEMAAV